MNLLELENSERLALASARQLVAKLESKLAAESTPRNCSAPAVIVPSRVAVSALDALNVLASCANEARVLAWLCADRIRGEGGGEAWGDFDEHPGFEDGIGGLAHEAVRRLEAALAEYRRAWEPRINRLRAHTAPVVPMALGYSDAEAVLAEGGFALGEFKDGFNEAIEHLENLLNLAAGALAKREIHVLSVVDAAVERLNSASLVVMFRTDAVRVALASVLREQSEQRQAA